MGVGVRRGILQQPIWPHRVPFSFPAVASVQATSFKQQLASADPALLQAGGYAETQVEGTCVGLQDRGSVFSQSRENM